MTTLPTNINCVICGVSTLPTAEKPDMCYACHERNKPGSDARNVWKSLDEVIRIKGEESDELDRLRKEMEILVIRQEAFDKVIGRLKKMFDAK